MSVIVGLGDMFSNSILLFCVGEDINIKSKNKKLHGKHMQLVLVDGLVVGSNSGN